MQRKARLKEKELREGMDVLKYRPEVEGGFCKREAKLGQDRTFKLRGKRVRGKRLPFSTHFPSP